MALRAALRKFELIAVKLSVPVWSIRFRLSGRNLGQLRPEAFPIKVSDHPTRTVRFAWRSGLFESIPFEPLVTRAGSQDHLIGMNGVKTEMSGSAYWPLFVHRAHQMHGGTGACKAVG